MKYIFFSAALLLSSTSAFAADAIVNNEPVPAAIAADTFSWTGGYIGLNGGFGGGQFKSNENDGNFKNSASGFLGGIQAGYNWQLDQAIIGLETDIQASGVKSEIAIGNNALSIKNNWFGTTRARIGYTPVDRFMVYATGGVAYGKVKVENPGLAYSETRTGYTVGGGAEYALTDHVTLKSEYLYTDLGKFKVQDFNGETLARFKAPIHTVRVGVNYKF